MWFPCAKYIPGILHEWSREIFTSTRINSMRWRHKEVEKVVNILEKPWLEFFIFLPVSYPRFKGLILYAENQQSHGNISHLHFFQKNVITNITTIFFLVSIRLHVPLHFLPSFAFFQSLIPPKYLSLAWGWNKAGSGRWMKISYNIFMLACKERLKIYSRKSDLKI